MLSDTFRYIEGLFSSRLMIMLVGRDDKVAINLCQDIKDTQIKIMSLEWAPNLSSVAEARLFLRVSAAMSEFKALSWSKPEGSCKLCYPSTLPTDSFIIRLYKTLKLFYYQVHYTLWNLTEIRWRQLERGMNDLYCLWFCFRGFQVPERHQDIFYHWSWRVWDLL